MRRINLLSIVLITLTLTFFIQVSSTLAVDPANPDNNAIINTSSGRIDNVNQLVQKLTGIGNVVLYLLVSLAVIYIVWNIVQYFIKGSDDEKVRKTAGYGILYGIIGLAIIVSLWGIVNVLIGTFKTDTTAPVDKFPKVNFTN